jgi:tRNA (Thr-GGU) A37 N-methylase
MRPIGRLRSVFAGRNGTPRQPLRLAPSARAELQLSSWVPADALEGLDGYTHVWLIYAFHANTDAGKTAAKAGAGGAATTAATAPSSFRAKVHVPRLDGGRLGVLATRSPHRPCPIGLSAARLIAVLPGGRLLLGGADVVDGTPVLDVKPYVPFCDSVEGATAPAWVAAEAREEEEEPLRVAEVVVSSEAEAKLRQAWESVVRSAGGRRNKGSLYDEADEFLALVREVLARDIRAAHNRLRAKAKAAAAADAAENGGEEDEEEDLEGRWHVVLDGVDVSYAVDRAGRVLIRSAVPAAVAAKQRGGDDDDDETGG